MTETSSKRHSRGTSTRFDRSRERLIFSILIALGVVLVLLVAAVLVNLYLPDVALSLQLGGMSRNKSVLPRNTDIWIADADGTLRFVTLVFPVKGPDGTSSGGAPVAGPYVKAAKDILESKSIGALSANTEILPGKDNDSGNVYESFWVEQDPASEVYGIDVLTTNSPYITDTQDANIKALSMGASKQDYYAQRIVAIAFAPGTQIDNIGQTVQAAADQATPVPEVFLRPYRRFNLNGWIVYYFDTTSLSSDQTIRIRYQIGRGSAKLDYLEVDAKR
jgi:ligand-binding sensor domain-containing protein